MTNINETYKGEASGLDFRERAFYSALDVNDSAVAILGDEVLRHIARELVDVVKKTPPSTGQ